MQSFRAISLPLASACVLCSDTCWAAAKGGLEKPSQKDGEDAEKEGEDGGEEETPPFPLLQALLVPEDGDAIRRRGLHHQLNDLPSL